MLERSSLHLALSVFNTIGVVACIAALGYLWNTMMAWRANAPIDGSTRAEVHRLTGRMLQFERELIDMRTLMTSAEQAAIQRDKERHETLKNLLTASTAQLDAMQRTLSATERIDRQQRYLNLKMDERPCMVNEKSNGTEPCPAGHPIDKARELQEVLPPVKLPPGFGDGEPDETEE